MNLQGKRQIFHFCFQNGRHQKLSKELYETSKELSFNLSSITAIGDLRNALANHPAFKVVRYV